MLILRLTISIARNPNAVKVQKVPKEPHQKVVADHHRQSSATAAVPDQVHREPVANVRCLPIARQAVLDVATDLQHPIVEIAANIAKEIVHVAYHRHRHIPWKNHLSHHVMAVHMQHHQDLKGNCLYVCFYLFS